MEDKEQLSDSNLLIKKYTNIYKLILTPTYNLYST